MVKSSFDDKECLIEDEREKEEKERMKNFGDGTALLMVDEWVQCGTMHVIYGDNPASTLTLAVAKVGLLRGTRASINYNTNNTNYTVPRKNSWPHSLTKPHF